MTDSTKPSMTIGLIESTPDEATERPRTDPNPIESTHRRHPDRISEERDPVAQTFAGCPTGNLQRSGAAVAADHGAGRVGITVTRSGRPARAKSTSLDGSSPRGRPAEPDQAGTQRT